MEIIDSDKIEKIKGMIKKSKRPIVLVAKDEDFNRKMLEYGRFDILLSPELSIKKRKLRQVSSGLNHVMADFAAKNNISIGVDLKSINEMDKKSKAQRIAAIKQNILLCRKSKASIKVLNYTDSKNALAFLAVLGASSSQAKQAISF